MEVGRFTLPPGVLFSVGCYIQWGVVSRGLSLVTHGQQSCCKQRRMFFFFKLMSVGAYPNKYKALFSVKIHGSLLSIFYYIQ